MTTLLPSLDEHAPVTRGAVMQTLLELACIPFDPAANTYADLPQTHRYAAAVLTATKLGIVSSDEGRTTVRPDDVLNRAEMAKIIVRLSSSASSTSVSSEASSASSAIPVDNAVWQQ